MEKIDSNKEAQIHSNLSIEVWSDYLCPWCYIGDANLNKALEELKADVSIVHKSFQSNPGQVRAESIYEIAQRNGMSQDAAKQRAWQIETMAKSAGLDVDMDKVIMVNTLKAHRLAQLAKQRGIGEQMTKRLLEGSFIQGRNIADSDVLKSLAESIGLDGSEINSLLESDDFQKEVQAEIQEAVQVGVRGVPFYLINGKYKISGAMSKDDFKNEISRIMRLELDAPKNRGTVCDEDGCSLVS